MKAPTMTMSLFPGGHKVKKTSVDMRHTPEHLQSVPIVTALGCSYSRQKAKGPPEKLHVDAHTGQFPYISNAPPPCREGFSRTTVTRSIASTNVSPERYLESLIAYSFQS